ncbi:MAG TPA: type 1 glutamine amidotransferase [Roseiarcus sp.]|nr:type 1 glutamine amidotransferase [Roseiarcus sp.]
MARLLVAEGNSAEGRRRIVSFVGQTPSESYAAVLRELAPEATVDICFPADADARMPAPLDSYDGVAITGSSLTIHLREPESLRQVEFARAAFALGLPMFGSCWGLQVATVAAGGEVRANPRGREVGFARKVTLTDAGRAHPLHSGRGLAFDAPAIHADEVATLPPGAAVTATNAMSQVQAAEIRAGASVVWAVQYHPEYSLADIAAVVRRYGQRLVDDGLFASLADLEAYARDLVALEASPARRDIAWRFDIGQDILDAAARRREIANWLTLQARPRG